jgi:hypothetical protein
MLVKPGAAGEEAYRRATPNRLPLTQRWPLVRVRLRGVEKISMQHRSICRCVTHEGSSRSVPDRACERP